MTVNCTNFWESMVSALQGMGVLATHSRRVPLGPPGPSLPEAPE